MKKIAPAGIALAGANIICDYLAESSIAVATMSACILINIAVLRYRKVCEKPLFNLDIML